MDLQQYRSYRQALTQAEPQFRVVCTACLQPEFSCYCRHIKRFNPHIEFAILIHPIEVRRRIATGRMSYLSLENSHLIMGQNYSNHLQVNKILHNPSNQCVILYPGINSIDLSKLNAEKRSEFFSPQKNLVIFVIDGTWATAKKMIHQSQNLTSLPRFCFTSKNQSNFRVRKQPSPGCFSTIEAIHQIIDLVGPVKGFDLASRKHDGLLKVFDRMVERQLEFIESARDNSKLCSSGHYRRVRRS